MSCLFGCTVLWALLCGPHISGLLVCPSSGGPSWPQESTLVAMKPNGVQERLVGTVIHSFEGQSFKMAGMKM